jgi:pimeloyl-ACP methyl ester carboxylesterase
MAMSFKSNAFYPGWRKGALTMKGLCFFAVAAFLLVSQPSCAPESKVDELPSTEADGEGDVAGQLFVETGDVKIDVRVFGEGRTLVLLPSLGRGVEDFDDLSRRLVDSGFRVVLPQPRGIGKSSGPLEHLTLHDLGDDIAAVIEQVGDAPVVLVGHALGNRIARVVASDHPELVEKVILLAAGGMVPIPEDILEALLSCFDMTLSRADRLEAIRKAFFADGNDPTVWEEGWYPLVARAQIDANQ